MSGFDEANEPIVFPSRRFPVLVTREEKPRRSHISVRIRHLLPAVSAQSVAPARLPSQLANERYSELDPRTILQRP
jgi:hypothetical protein